MKKVFPTILILSLGLLAGCAIDLKHPLTADEFRAGVPGAFMATVEKYQVSQPYDQVVARFKEMAPKCLDVTIKTTSQSMTSYQVIVTDYNPTVIVGENRTELHVQQDFLQGVMTVSEVPPGGYYLMVFDATRIDGNTTQIEYYGPSRGFETMVKAIKGWASGGPVGCPDLTQ